ncbi:MAG TPA: DUF1501 domain-containing protein [Ktedonobacterales bacterium]|nr:DUF1501 domain-containing protein [Ktedonobacterales bacterium]
MFNISRRAMMKDGLLVVTAGMLMPSIFGRAVRAAHNAAQEGDHLAFDAQGRTLIVVQMAGGNDGLNTIVPYTDSLYYQARPTLAIQQKNVLTLNDRLGFNPALQALKPFWDQQKLAIVEGVGYPNPSLSHFQAMDIWQSLDLNGQGTEGWLGKYVAGLVDKDGHPFQSLDIGVQLPAALRAINAQVPTLTQAQSYQLLADPANKAGLDARTQALLRLYDSYPKTAPYAALLDATAQNAQQGSKALIEADAAYKPAVTYPTGPFADGLKVLAEVIVQGLGLRVGYITLGGFDTHANQVNDQTTLLQTLAEGLDAFYNDLVAHGKADDVVIMTWSEFGRRVHENGNAGTDHGTAAPLFVMGNAVTGGFYGEPPDLGNLDQTGNLKFTIDFRQVYATVLDRWLGAPSQAILGGSFGNQNFLPLAG